MALSYLSRRPVVAAGSLALALLAGGAVAFYCCWGSGSSTEPARDSYFVEAAEQAGIRFHMRFLPTEQGVQFKINLYDHGCGLSVADFDGDGYDDIFFANQLGKCALYRNRGDGTFEDVTERAGVGLGDRVCVMGVWGDYDNDGKPDLYVTSTRGGNVLFRNRGDGTFEDVTEKAGLSLVLHSQSAVFFDFDKDGHPDLFVINTARWTLEKANKEDGYFPGPATLAELAKAPIEEHTLYRSRGDGTFEDVTAKAGLQGKGWAGDVAVFDFDGDGWLDLFITNMFGASQLYRNNGDGSFSDHTAKVFPKTSWGAIGARAFDFDNDGRLDLFVTDMHSDMWLPPTVNPREIPHLLTKKYPYILGEGYNRSSTAAVEERKWADLFRINYSRARFGNTLHRCLGKGKFEEVSDQAGLETWWPWGIAVGDFDNDGYEDAFIPAGMGFPYPYWPNSLMINNGDGTFTDHAYKGGIDPPAGGEYLEQTIGGMRASRSARAAAVSDFRQAGKLDLVVNNFNGRASYFRNERERRNYVQFLLEGSMRPGGRDGREKRKSSRDAVGALVYLRMGKEVMVRQVQGAGGYLSQSSRVLHFGLGSRTSVGEVEVVWPSGRRQVLKGIEVNRLHVLEEPGDEKP
jgi:hypothetical protein